MLGASASRQKTKITMGVILIIKGATQTATPTNPSNPSNPSDQPATQTVATPVISIDSSTGTVTITCATAGASIRYTTDGTAPTTASALYTMPFTLQASATVKAIATKTGFAASAVAAQTYTAEFTGQQLITASETEGAFLSGGGATHPLAEWNYSEYVRIPPGATNVSGTIATYFEHSIALCFYDASMNYAGGTNTLAEVAGQTGNNGAVKWGTISAAIPEGAKYLRYCYDARTELPAVPQSYRVPQLYFT